MDIIVANQIAQLQADISRAMIYCDIALIVGAIFIIIAVISIILLCKDWFDDDEFAIELVLGVAIIGIFAIGYGLWQMYVDIPIMQTQLEQLKAMAEASV